MATRVAIVGAGVTGLVAARELARMGASVHVLERWPDVGGQASAFEVTPGVWLERYYHHLFPSDREMVALHDELLPGELEWHRSTVAMWTRGRAWPFVTPLDLLRYAPLPPLDRLRLGITTLRLATRHDANALDHEPAVAWLRRASGQRAVDAVWGPLMFGKFGDDASAVPLAWFASKLTLRRQNLTGRGAGSERLGYPRHSFQAISRALADDIRVRGGQVDVDRSVVDVQRDADGFVLRCAAERAYRSSSSPVDRARDARADAVLFTTPTTETLHLLDWPDTYACRLAEWRYRAAVVLLLELAAPFSSTYWTNIVDAGTPFLGLIEHTNLVPAERYAARYLYVSNYVAPDDPLMELDTDALLQAYLPALAAIRPGFDQRSIRRAWSFRERAAQPVPRTPNTPRVLPFATPVAGAYVANTTQIYPEDRGTNYSVRLGRDVARVMGADLRLGPTRP